MGDIIQLYRYLRLLEHKRADVTLKIKPNLHPLLQTIGSNSRLRKIFLKENEIDFESPLVSPSYLLNANLETIPETILHLHADQDEIKTWIKSLRKDSFKIGSCWQGSKATLELSANSPADIVIYPESLITRLLY